MEVKAKVVFSLLELSNRTIVNMEVQALGQVKNKRSIIKLQLLRNMTTILMMMKKSNMRQLVISVLQEFKMQDYKQI